MSNVQTAARNFLTTVAMESGIPESDFWRLVSYGVEALKQEGAQVAESVCAEVLKDRQLAEKQAQAKAKPSKAHLELIQGGKSELKSSQPLPTGDKQ